MSTINDTLGSALVPQLAWQKFTIAKLVDFTVLSPTAADVVQCINVKEGMYITDVRTMIIVAAGATMTCDIGDGTDPNGFDNSVNLNALAQVVTIGVTGTDDYITNGRYYTQDDTIDLTIDNTNSTGKVLLMVDGFYIQDTTVHSTL